MNSPKHTDSSPSLNSPRLVGVIDIGATSIRLAISQVDSDGHIENLESLSQSVSLGRDSFIDGSIGSRTIEECVRVLRIYRQKLSEYQITNKRNIHIVATSAVREARNRLALIDRIYIATGFEIEPFDEAELHRVTYLGIQPILKSHPVLHELPNVVCEIGGGSTEILVVDQGDVLFSETYRMGSLRLRKTLEAYHTPISKEREIMQGQIFTVIQRLRRSLPELKSANFIGMGGDLRFAADRITALENVGDLKKLSVDDFEAFTDKIISSTPDQLFNQYTLSFPEAESLGPALLAYLNLIKSFKLDTFFVSNVNMRQGLVREMVQPQVWNREFRDQVIRFAVDLGRMYQFDEEYAMNVADISKELFDGLQELHELDDKHSLILTIAAMLHEIGQFVNHRGFHKHTLYLIRNSDFFGLGRKNVLLTGLVARYHRRAHPQPNHDGYTSLSRKERVIVTKLAAILRLAIALCATRKKRFTELDCLVGDELLTLRVPLRDYSLERLSLNQNSLLFQETFGKKVELTDK